MSAPTETTELLGHLRTDRNVIEMAYLHLKGEKHSNRDGVIAILKHAMDRIDGLAGEPSQEGGE